MESWTTSVRNGLRVASDFLRTSCESPDNKENHLDGGNAPWGFIPNWFRHESHLPQSDQDNLIQL